MSDPQYILILDEKNKASQHLSRFLSRISIQTEQAFSLEEASHKLLKANNFFLVIIHADPLENHTIKIIDNIKSFNPQLGIILLSKIENPDQAISLLQKETIDQVTSPDNLAGILSAIKNEFSKRQLLQKNSAFMQRIQEFKSEHKRDLKRALNLEEIYDSTLDNLMTALDLRDVETFGHSRTVAKYSQVLAEVLGIRDKTIRDNIRKGALLHDVGKIAIPDSILKKPSPLSVREWEKIKLHPALGFGLIKEIKLVKEVGNIILHHHERFDGTGYPNRLKKNMIPKEARIFMLADALDAITSPRPYRKERNFTLAKQEILDNSGTQFDPEVVDAFCSDNLDKWEKIRFETTKIMPFMEDMLQI